MEPIKDWLDDACQQVAPKEPRGIPGSGVYQHPDEDCFQVPVAIGDELTAVPDRSGPMPAFVDMEMPLPVRYLTENDSAVFRGLKAIEELDPSGVPTELFFKETPFASPEQAEAFHTFMNVASLAERIPSVADNVVLPKHYARFKIEPIRFICENNLNFFQGNIIKYVLRHDAKNGLEDLRKARRYLNMFIKFVEGDPDWWKADAS